MQVAEVPNGRRGRRGGRERSTRLLNSSALGDNSCDLQGAKVIEELVF